MDIIHKLIILPISLILAGCASYGTINNQFLEGSVAVSQYSISQSNKYAEKNDIMVALAFSGGGTRAAALSYGVLKALRDTPIQFSGSSGRLIDEVDLISSVSGGSFTAAYYGLYGDKLFTDFESNFLRYNFKKDLIYGLFRPTTWFSGKGRTEMAVHLYEKHVFKDATFADFNRYGAPLVIINASDLGSGVRFSFLQEYFDLLCSDLSSYPVSRAVAASSAVPVMFNPVVLENYSGCRNKSQQHLHDIQINNQSPQILQTLDGLSNYADKKNRYIHLVDGGITDNLGLMAFYEMIGVSGGVNQFIQRMGVKTKTLSRILVISVNASTDPQDNIELSNKSPSINKTISAMSGIQLRRYNTAVLQLVDESMTQWVDNMSTEQNKVEAYFIKLDFKNIIDPVKREYINQIPTSFSLEPGQVDMLISVGQKLLIDDSEFQRFVKELNK